MDSMSIEIPHPDYDNPKEIWAFFGLTAYSANLIEQSLVNLAVVLQLPALNLLSREAFEETFGDLEERTLGQLLKAARLATSIPDDLDELLHQALRKRNYLIHRFFREHAEDALSNAGRRLMINELRDMLAFLKDLDPRLQRIYLALWQEYGVDDDFIRKEFAEMQARARERNGAS